MADRALAWWVVEPGHSEIRAEQLPAAGPGEVLVRAVCSGISRGTELLVFRGGVPPEEADRMRAPFQVGDFPGPVKYGYLSVGVVEQGPDKLAGRTVFCLHPHQDWYVVPADAVTVVPDSVPPDRAVLAGTMETALNAVWDALPMPGDRVAVVGGGMVGCCLARLLARLPLVEVVLVDVDGDRARTAAALGVDFALPGQATGERDVVFHTSATAGGLRLALDLLVDDGTLFELSWYGDRGVEVGLGGAFHSRRLAVRASQVGEVAASRRGRRTRAERLALALELLDDPTLDALVSGSVRLDELPEVMCRMAAGQLTGVLHTVAYDNVATEVQPCSA